jgi:Tol biopolymer transport system component
MLKRVNAIKQPAYCKLSLLGILLSAFILLKAQDKTFPVLHGKYLGQKPPGDKAMLFAKDIISTPLYEHSAPAFSPDGKTVLWTVLDMGKPARLLEMTMTGNTWGKPFIPSFADSSHDDFYPFFSPDGRKLFFSSRRALPTGTPVRDICIWTVERKHNGWGKPIPLDSAVSKGFEYAHSVSGKGNLFFSAREVLHEKPEWKIYYSNLINGRYTEPKPLGSSVNTGAYVDGPYISPDEQFLIFESDREGGIGSIDLYICFKEKNGKWSAPENMGEKINTTFAERFAGVSPDGKYLFFGSNRNGTLPDIYWINAAIIAKLKNHMKSGTAMVRVRK